MSSEVNANSTVGNVSSWISQKATMASEAVVGGTKRTVEWVCAGSSKEGVLLSMGLSAVSMIATEMGLRKFFEDSDHPEYYRLMFATVGLALSVVLTPTIGGLLKYAVTYQSALKVAALNLSTRVGVFGLSQLYGSYYETTADEETSSGEPTEAPKPLAPERKKELKPTVKKILDNVVWGTKPAMEESKAKALMEAPEDLKGDQSFVLDVVSRNGLALQYASPELQNNKKVVLAAIGASKFESTPSPLKYASPKLQNDKKVVMAAVKQKGRALENASPELQGKEDIVIAALRPSNQSAFQYASDELRNDQEFILKHLKKYAGMMEHVADKLKVDDTFLVKAAETNGMVLKYIKPSVQTKPIALAAVTQNGDAEDHVASKLRNDSDITEAASAARKKKNRGSMFNPMNWGR